LRLGRLQGVNGGDEFATVDKFDGFAMSETARFARVLAEGDDLYPVA